jgi:hypothetical protein
LAAPLLPEFLGVLGIDVFLILSILTCLFDFPAFIQYVYHLSAFIGFGQLWINYIFVFGEETRFFICLGYLIIGLANIIFVNAYIAFRDKKILWTTSFMSSVTIPAILISFVAASSFVNKIPISLPWLPLIPMEVIATILVICGVALAASVIFSTSGLKPRTSTNSKRKGGDQNK